MVLHATAGTDSLDWLSGGSSPPVSSHFLVGKSMTWRIVPDNEIAYHAGISKYYPYGGIHGEPGLNSVSLGVEIENLNDGVDPYTAYQVDKVADIVVQFYAAYGRIPVVSHEAVAPGRKTDPYLFPWAAFWGKVESKFGFLESIS